MSDSDKLQEIIAFLEKRRARTVEDIFGEYLDAKPDTPANAVMVPVRGMPYGVMIHDFDRGTKAVPPESMRKLEAQVEFPVCCISAFKPEDGSENRFIEHFTFMDQCYGSCLICGYEGGKPAPLNNEQAQFACDVLAYARILANRGEL